MDEDRKNVKREGQPEVFFEKSSDQEMKGAMEKARLTLHYFQKSLTNPLEGQFGFSVKAKIVDGDNVEHIWLTDVSNDEDGSFFGTVNNEPLNVKNVAMGSKIGVARKDVSDWLIVENGRLIGGYTIRVFRDSMTAEQQAEFDESLGLHIDEGEDHFEHNMKTPEGAILCLEDAYSAGDLEAAIACKDFLTEARLMLAQIPGMPQDEEIINKAAETLEVAFRGSLEESEMTNFEGVKRAFLSRDYVDEDMVVVTEFCIHPDGMRTLDRLIVTRFGGDEWRVGPPANEEE